MTNTENTIAWASGIVEGEGCFVFANGLAKCIAVSMTDKDVLDRLHENFGGNIYKLKMKEAHWKQAWVWKVAGDEGLNFTAKILPYLCSRRSKRAQEWVDNLKSRRQTQQDTLNNAQEKRAKILELLQTTNLKQREIAEIFGVERSYVASVKTGRFK